MEPGSKLPWWRTTTIYQVYPRSFADSNNDGVGDLGGILSKLDYLQDLGFETLWFSPFFSSPQCDFGYDISDHYEIAPEYGTLADVEALIQAVHRRGMRVLFDLVLNHTSIQHPWFQASRSSRDHPKRDWYIWRDGRRSRPPNNWKAIPGGSGWHYDAQTDQWYYASFLPFQPDLNWRNPEVKQAMFDVIRFWLEVGVDGFRLDIFHTVFKDAGFRDNPFKLCLIDMENGAGYFQDWKYSLNQPEVFELARELRALVGAYTPERMLIGEVFGSLEQQKRFLGEDLDGLNLAFLWELLNLKGSAAFLRQAIRHYERQYPAPYTPVYVYGNHDRKRVASHVSGDFRVLKLLALMQFTARGVPVTYYGEEIGMLDGHFPVRNALDPVAQRFAWAPAFLLNALGVYVNRDGCRTPMQWNSSLNAGFCSPEVAPWLPVQGNRDSVNAADQLADPESLLNLYRTLLRLRWGTPVLQSGSLDLIAGPDLDVNILAYTRSLGDQNLLVAMNFGPRATEFRHPVDYNQCIFATGISQSAPLPLNHLPPYAGIVLSN